MKGWETKRLGEVLEIQNGFAFDSKGFNPTRGLPLIRIRSLKAGIEEETRFDGRYDERYVVQAGDLLIGMDGEFGCYEWKGGPSLLNQRVCRLQGFSGELLPKFLFYGVNDHLKEIEDVTGFATVKHLSSKQILGIQFPVPPLDEQRRIVTILDEALSGLATAQAHAEKNLKNARALFDSHLQAVFTQRGKGWVERTLEDVVDAGCTLSYGIVQPGEDYPNGMPVVRPTDLTAKVIVVDGLKRIDPRLGDGYRRTMLRGGELLLCVRGSTGVVSTAAPELAGANVTRGIVPIAFDQTILRQEFGYFLMISEAVQSQIRAKTYGTALMQINIGDLRKLTVSFPSLVEQKSISVRLEKFAEEIQRLQRLYHQKQSALADLKKSLLHQAFSGAL